jgi:hypothetical protein
MQVGGAFRRHSATLLFSSGLDCSPDQKLKCYLPLRSTVLPHKLLAAHFVKKFVVSFYETQKHVAVNTALPESVFNIL